MVLTNGTRLGPYEILDLLGTGGMGAVYRARDTKLGREVALKVLPDEFAQNEERLARFEREARLLASLNHPNIATLFDLEEEQDVHFLTMELVEGETLAERIARGPIPVDEAVRLFAQVAEGLDAAHEKGVIHRDLKPANIMITPEGRVKILDFGLAKESRPSGASDDLSQAPTLPRGNTQSGVILGTAPYMSPEQARGETVDKRADIWAFGCCLYEAISGSVPFLGTTAAETISRILEREPDWNALPDLTPNISRLLRHCLMKDKRRRLRDIGDASFTFDETSPSHATAAPSLRSTARLVAGSLFVAAMMSALGLWLFNGGSTLPGPVRKLKVKLDRAPLRKMAVAPDGTRLVYVARIDGTRRLVERQFDQLEENVLPGTEDAYSPFFSPDGQWIGFTTQPDSQSGGRGEGALKKLSLEGGSPITLHAPVLGNSAVWGEDDFIFFQSAFGGEEILRVSSLGGAPESVVTPDNNTIWSLQDILPGGKAIIGITEPGEEVVSISLSTGKVEVLADAINRLARFVRTGHLLFQVKEGALVAAPFDHARVAVTGAVVPMVEGVGYWTVSGEGSLIYSDQTSRQLVWVNRQGEATLVDAESGLYQSIRLSPDGTRVALHYADSSVANQDVWVYDLLRGSSTRLTFDPARDYFPLWAVDGRKIAFVSHRGNSWGIFRKAVDGSGEVEPLLTGPREGYPTSWSLAGEHLVYEDEDPRTNSGIGLLTLSGDRDARLLIQEPFDQTNPVVSPDGRLLAYESNETGRLEVYVRRFPELGDKRQISNRGGAVPVWAPSGDELFYRIGDAMMVVTIQTRPSFVASEPKVLFTGEYLHYAGRAYDIDPTGQRFLMIRSEDSASDPTELNFVVNWFEELNRLAPSHD